MESPKLYAPRRGKTSPMRRARRRLRTLRLLVPASTSNVGPGFDALGIALDLRLSVTWTPAARTRLQRRGALAESSLPARGDPLLRGLRRAAALARARLPAGDIIVDAPFPPGRGLGASGAAIAAGLLLGNRLTGNRLSRQALLDAAIRLEGHPENAVAAFLGGAHWSAPGTDGRWIHQPVPLHRDLRFLLVIPPYPLSTERARKALPATVPFQRAAAQARRGPILLEGLRTLDRDRIRAGLQDDLHVAARLGLLPGAAQLLDDATRAGALGATVSGAGSALLVLTRSRDLPRLEARLWPRVQRVWGGDGGVLAARPGKPLSGSAGGTPAAGARRGR
ncbi:MAG: homoserine kinase [Planctomycetota bacterium]|nr:MAG: homoserine kinase [Planctomycetota bacterium]